MDEYEKRMTHKAAIESLVNIVVAFKPDTVMISGKEKIVEDEQLKRYAKRWVDMAFSFIGSAEALGAGYADYTMNLLGLKIVAKPETAS